MFKTNSYALLWVETIWEVKHFSCDSLGYGTSAMAEQTEWVSEFEKLNFRFLFICIGSQLTQPLFYSHFYFNKRIDFIWLFQQNLWESLNGYISMLLPMHIRVLDEANWITTAS